MPFAIVLALVRFTRATKRFKLATMLVQQAARHSAVVFVLIALATTQFDLASAVEFVLALVESAMATLLFVVVQLELLLASLQLVLAHI